jgi:hypothetical protein
MKERQAGAPWLARLARQPPVQIVDLIDHAWRWNVQSRDEPWHIWAVLETDERRRL